MPDNIRGASSYRLQQADKTLAVKPYARYDMHARQHPQSHYYYIYDIQVSNMIDTQFNTNIKFELLTVRLSVHELTCSFWRVYLR